MTTFKWKVWKHVWKFEPVRKTCLQTKSQRFPTTAPSHPDKLQLHSQSCQKLPKTAKNCKTLLHTFLLQKLQQQQAKKLYNLMHNGTLIMHNSTLIKAHWINIMLPKRARPLKSRYRIPRHLYVVKMIISRVFKIGSKDIVSHGLVGGRLPFYNLYLVSLVKLCSTHLCSMCSTHHMTCDTCHILSLVTSRPGWHICTISPCGEMSSLSSSCEPRSPTGAVFLQLRRARLQ